MVKLNFECLVTINYDNYSEFSDFLKANETFIQPDLDLIRRTSPNGILVQRAMYENYKNSSNYLKVRSVPKLKGVREQIIYQKEAIEYIECKRLFTTQKIKRKPVSSDHF